jgi:hypothetical protein
MEYYHASTSGRYCRCSSWRADRQFFIKPYRERKADLKAHHDYLVTNILKKWIELQVTPSNEKSSKYTTVIPLYLGIVDKIDSIDEYKEGLMHLCDKRYSESLSIYNKMKELEQSHNDKVSDYMEKTESDIKDRLWNNNDIHLKDVNFLKRVYTDPDFLKQSIEKGEFGKMDYEATKMGALNDTIGVYYDNLFNHILQQSTDYKNDILQVETLGQKGSAWYFPTLFRSDSRDKFIARGVPGSKSIVNLKNLIENEFKVEDLTSLREFQSNIEEMQKLFAKFSQNIKKITHDYHALRLRGKCRIENEISIFRALFRMIK